MVMSVKGQVKEPDEGWIKETRANLIRDFEIKWSKNSGKPIEKL
jgi:hypothetical protein